MNLIIDLEPTNLRKATNALAQLEYRPRAPVGLTAFADPEQRARWVREKGLTVFSLYSPRHPATEVDVFVEMPLDFERAYRAAAKMDVAPGVSATFIGFDDLLRLKAQLADRRICWTSRRCRDDGRRVPPRSVRDSVPRNGERFLVNHGAEGRSAVSITVKDRMQTAGGPVCDKPSCS